MKTATHEALVVGGGVIGLASAFRLARDGWRVTLFDPTPGKGATWAAAGMIAPSAEIAPGELSNYELQKRALPAWRALADELRDVTGELLEIRETGTLLIGWDASDRRLVAQFAEVAKEFGVQPREVSRQECEDMFVGVSGRVHQGLFIAGDASLDPDRAVNLLERANEALGVRLVRELVTDVETTSQRVGVATASDRFEAAFGILATGADALPSGAVSSGANVVRPVRGFTVRAHGIDRSHQSTIRAFVHGHLFYMLSRPGGYCVLGATSDERSEPVVELGDLQRLLRDALDVIPALESADVLETRLGLRPASVNLEPFFEVLSGGRWAWSSGHYRHGVTLAPLAALDAARFGGDL